MTRSLLSAAVCFALALPLAAQPASHIIWSEDVEALSAAFSPDGSLLAVGAREALYLYSVEEGSLVDSVALRNTLQVRDGNAVAFSPDGSTLVSGHGSVYCNKGGGTGGCYAVSEALYTWNAETLDPISSRTDLPPVESVAFTPDGSTVVAGFFYDLEEAIRVLDPATLDVTRSIAGAHDRQTYAVDVAPDGATFASVGYDDMLRVWDVATGEQRFAVEAGSYFEAGEPLSIAYSPDGQRLVTGGGGSDAHVRVWDAADGALLRDFEALLGPGEFSTHAIATFSPNGAYVVGGLSEMLPGAQEVAALRIWDVETGEMVTEVEEVVEVNPGGFFKSLSFSPESGWMAYVLGDKVKVLDAPFLLNRSVATEGGPVADVFALSPGSPNPFSEATTFRLSVAETQRVRAEVFDVLGRRVSTVLDREVPAGSGVSFSVSGARLPAGAYVVRVTGDAFAAVRRVTHLR